MMGSAPRLQKLCQFDNKRLILTVGSIFIVVLVLQSSLLPNVSVLLSLFSVKSVIVSELIPLHDSNFTNSSWAVNNTVETVVGKVIVQKSESKGNKKDPGYESHTEEDQTSDSSEEDVGFDKNPELEKSDILEDQEKVMTSDSEDTNLTVEKVPSAPGFVSPSHNLTDFSDLSSGNSSTSDVLEEPQISSVGEHARETILKGDIPVSLQKGSGRGARGKNKKMVATSLSEMNRLLFQSRASSRAMRPRWSSVRDQELLSAKLQIETAPIVKNDPALYSPLFRNISMFKRSYDLMEHIFKVYTYSEGEKPIFHQPLLKGIYASEGWFMKLMEENKQFVVKDPRKAHMFYFPLSLYMLRIILYESYSKKHKKLAEYVKDYTVMIAGKYPYWNRTGGADHFIVGCHDWAPQETKQYMGHSIRAICNANVARDFQIGKDVSLPVTFVRNPEDPLKSLGGKPLSKRSVLAFFAGRMHGNLRQILLQYWENKDTDMKIFGPLPRVGDGKMTYIQYMKNSKYCICAKGYEVHTPRVVEAIFYGCIPVIISDNYVPPFFEILNWEAFSLFIAEKDIPNLKNILLAVSEKKYRALQMGVKKAQKHFLWHKKPLKYDIFHMILHSIWYNRVFQIKPR